MFAFIVILVFSEVARKNIFGMIFSSLVDQRTWTLFLKENHLTLRTILFILPCTSYFLDRC